jgi:hypothetical protein
MTEENPMVGRGYTLNEYRTNQSVRDQIDRADFTIPRTSDDHDIHDALEFRARANEAGDRKLAALLRAASREIARLEAMNVVLMQRVDVAVAMATRNRPLPEGRTE